LSTNVRLGAGDWLLQTPLEFNATVKSFYRIGLLSAIHKTSYNDLMKILQSRGAPYVQNANLKVQIIVLIRPPAQIMIVRCL
jgi:hypothetical protein